MGWCGERVGCPGGRLRGQSNVIAVVLLVAMVLTSATIVVFAGSMALTENQDEASLESATHSMQSLDQKVEAVSAGETSQGDVELNDRQGDMQIITESPSDPAKAGKITITVDPPSGSNTVEEMWLGTVHYERDGRSVAYQGGGVWQRTGEGSTAVSPPKISYRSGGSDDGTLDFPVVTLDGDAAGSTLQIETVERKQLASLLSLSNPVGPGTRITIEIRSEYYQAWADTLATEIDTDAVQTDASDQKLTLELESPRSSTAPSAVLGTNPAGGLAIANHGKIDSYDSSTGPHTGFPANNNGDVLTKGAIDPSNQMSVRGDLIAEDGLDGVDTLSNQIEIYRRTILGNDPDIDDSTGSLKIAGNHQTFHGTFSTQDNLQLSVPTVFRGDVLVAGDLNVVANKNQPTEFRNGGDVVVEGEVEKISSAEISGNLIVDGDAEQIGTKGTEIQGDVVANGHVELDSDAVVHGDVVVPHGTSPDIDSGATVHGSVRKIDFSTDGHALDTAPKPITPDVPEREDAVARIDSWSSALGPSSNDNDEEDVIDGNELDFGGTSEHTLEPGEYYLERLNVPGGETLTLDTSSGDVVIYLPDHPSQTAVRVDGTLKVDGPDPEKRARIYIDDAAGGDSVREVEVTGTGQVEVPQDKSGNLWLYLKPSAEVDFNNNAFFKGVVYGPNDGTHGGAEIEVNNNAEVFGALLGDVTKIPNQAQVHYDEALSDEEAFTTSPGVSTIDYVHFSEQTVSVED